MTNLAAAFCAAFTSRPLLLLATLSRLPLLLPPVPRLASTLPALDLAVRLRVVSIVATVPLVLAIEGVPLVCTLPAVPCRPSEVCRSASDGVRIECAREAPLEMRSVERFVYDLPAPFAASEDV